MPALRRDDASRASETARYRYRTIARRNTTTPAGCETCRGKPAKIVDTATQPTTQRRQRDHDRGKGNPETIRRQIVHCGWPSAGPHHAQRSGHAFWTLINPWAACASKSDNESDGKSKSCFQIGKRDILVDHVQWSVRQDRTRQPGSGSCMKRASESRRLSTAGRRPVDRPRPHRRCCAQRVVAGEEKQGSAGAAQDNSQTCLPALGGPPRPPGNPPGPQKAAIRSGAFEARDNFGLQRFGRPVGR